MRGGKGCHIVYILNEPTWLLVVVWRKGASRLKAARKREMRRVNPSSSVLSTDTCVALI